MIGLLSSPLNPDKQAYPHSLVGSEVARQEFVKNLLRCLPEGAVGFFAPQAIAAPAGQELTRLSENGYGRAGGLWSLSALPEVLSGQRFIAFHNPVAPELHQLSYLRSEFAPHPFPITCIAHGFSQAHLLWDLFTRLLLTPTLPCDSVVCTSHAARRAFQNTLSQVRAGLEAAGMTGPRTDLRLDLIPLGVDTDLYRPRDKQDVRNLLGLPQEKTLLLYFGRMDTAGKADMNPLLIAFRELLDRHEDRIVLVLAGAAPEPEMNSIMHSADQLGCADHVLLRPQPPLPEGPLYYAACDIFVSLSDTVQESFGISPLEAMSSGLPAVVSDWSGYHETIVSGETGYHVKTYWAECDSDISLFSPLQGWRNDHLRLGQSIAADMSQLVQCLDALISNPAQRLRMGEAARQHVLEHYDWKHIIARYWELWAELAQVAASLPPQKPTPQHLLCPQYFRNFGHFASQTLTGAESLRITERGRRVYRRPDMLMHSEMRHTIQPNILKVILKIVKMSSFFKYGVTVEDICGRIASKHYLTPQQMLAHILWLLKYGLLQIA